MQNRCRTYLPSVSFCGLTYIYRKSAFFERRKIINENCKSRAKLFAKKYIRKIVKSTLQNEEKKHFIIK